MVGVFHRRNGLAFLAWHRNAHASQKQTQNAINLWRSSVACSAFSTSFFRFFRSLCAVRVHSEFSGRRRFERQTVVVVVMFVSKRLAFCLIPFNANELRVPHLISTRRWMLFSAVGGDAHRFVRSFARSFFLIHLHDFRWGLATCWFWP